MGVRSRLPALLALPLLTCSRSAQRPPVRLPTLVLACTVGHQAGLVHVALESGYFAEEGLSVEVKPLAFGKPALAAVTRGEGDALMMERVWSNLLTDAIKYSIPDQEHLMEIEDYSKDGSSTYSVRDHGVGFDMRHADKL